MFYIYLTGLTEKMATALVLETSNPVQKMAQDEIICEEMVCSLVWSLLSQFSFLGICKWRRKWWYARSASILIISAHLLFTVNKKSNLIISLNDKVTKKKKASGVEDEETYNFDQFF